MKFISVIFVLFMALCDQAKADGPSPAFPGCSSPFHTGREEVTQCIENAVDMQHDGHVDGSYWEKVSICQCIIGKCTESCIDVCSAYKEARGWSDTDFLSCADGCRNRLHAPKELLNICAPDLGEPPSHPWWERVLPQFPIIVEPGSVCGGSVG